jgi:hypothetical protein
VIDYRQPVSHKHRVGIHGAGVVSLLHLQPGWPFASRTNSPSFNAFIAKLLQTRIRCGIDRDICEFSKPGAPFGWFFVRYKFCLV